MQTTKSIAEIETIQLILDMEEKIDRTKLTVEDGKALISKSSKCLEKCTELRKSRDKWRTKYEELKNSTIS